MKNPHKLYIDCSAGISGDMLLAGLRKIAEEAGVEVKAPKLTEEHHHDNKNHKHHDHNHNDHDHNHHDHDHDHHGRSYTDVKKMISNADAGETAKAIALNIYAAIAKAEAQVHEKTLETVHFHEVGRDRAIENALGIGAALEALGAGTTAELTDTADLTDQASLEILVSTIYDGTGFIDCAHGRIPVPVPAVQAMKEQCPGFSFETAEEVKTEMVTPSGLAALIGIGAKATDEAWNQSKECIAFAEVKGTRSTGRGGLKLYLAE